MDVYYFDAGVFLTPLLKNQPAKVVHQCRTWMMRIDRGEIEACTSWLTWDEVTYIAGRVRGSYDHASAAEAGRLFLAVPNLHFLPIEDRVIEAAQNLIDTLRIRPRDSIHAASALRYAGGNLVTVDSDFVALSGADRVPDLRVVLVGP